MASYWLLIEVFSHLLIGKEKRLSFQVSYSVVLLIAVSSLEIWQVCDGQDACVESIWIFLMAWLAGVL